MSLFHQPSSIFMVLVRSMTTYEPSSIRKILECKKPCDCSEGHVTTKSIAITGGPGAGKTSFIELARKTFCKHVAILPEAAAIVYTGGFPRSQEPLAVIAAQKSIWYVMRELEQLALSVGSFHTILCDRGSLDGVAYWPQKGPNFYATLGTTEEQEIRRYDVAIHMRTPSSNEYEGMNAFRIESSQQALDLDRKTMDAWKKHPHQTIIEGANNFMEKIQSVFDAVNEHIPACCK